MLVTINGYIREEDREDFIEWLDKEPEDFYPYRISYANVSLDKLFTIWDGTVETLDDCMSRKTKDHISIVYGYPRTVQWRNPSILSLLRQVHVFYRQTSSELLAIQSYKKINAYLAGYTINGLTYSIKICLEYEDNPEPTILWDAINREDLLRLGSTITD